MKAIAWLLVIRLKLTTNSSRNRHPFPLLLADSFVTFVVKVLVSLLTRGPFSAAFSTSPKPELVPCHVHSAPAKRHAFCFEP